MKPYLIAITIVTVAYLAHHFIVKSSVFRLGANKLPSNERMSVNKIVLQRMLGVIFFGVIPCFAVLWLFGNPLVNYGLSSGNLSLSAFWIALLSAIILVLNYANARNKANLEMYPQIRIQKWSIRIILISAFSWIAYLAAYEFMFRGFLLFAINENLGTTAAIIITTAIYSLAHVPKGAKEAFGAIPFGALLGYLTLISGNILIAFAVHVVMALTNEWFSIRAHPEMEIVFSEKRK